MVERWRNELQELAGVQCSGEAVSFYFYPHTVQNQAHREDLILARDLVRDATRRAEREGGSSGLRSALERIAAAVEQIAGGRLHAQAIFACPAQEIWREFDLGAAVGKTQLHLNDRFHLAPMATAAFAQQRATAVLLDREHAAIFELEGNHISERERIKSEVPTRVRTQGFAGYEGNHIIRHVEEHEKQHFKNVAERLLLMHTTGVLGRLVVGCRAEVWPDVELQLHTYVKQALIGRFQADTTCDAATIKAEALGLLEEVRLAENDGIVREAMGEAQRDGRGSVGLRHVLTSLERGEVQTLILGDDYSAALAECGNCGHLDTRMVSKCAVCASAVREVEDGEDALVAHALKRGVELAYVNGNDELNRAGGIAALLRFRADQNTPQKLAG